MKVWSPRFNMTIVLLSRAAGSVSNLSAFDFIGKKVRKIACDHTVISRLCHQTSIMPHSVSRMEMKITRMEITREFKITKFELAGSNCTLKADARI